MTEKRKQHGMVLMDLLLGLMIGAIVLAAAATMADAMSHGKRANEQISRSANYLAQLHIRLSDLVMRAETIEPRDEGGVTLTYSGGHTADLYTDAQNRIVIADNPGITSWLSDPAQAAVSISAAGVNRVVITFDITENDVTRKYTMTATRRGGLLE